MFSSVILLLVLLALATSSPIPPARHPQTVPNALSVRDDQSDGINIIDIVNKWRGIYGLPTLNWDGQVRNGLGKDVPSITDIVPSSSETLLKLALTMEGAPLMASSTSSILPLWLRSWQAACKPTVAICME